MDQVTLIRTLYSRYNLRRGLGRLTMTMAMYSPSLQLFPVPMDDGRMIYLDLRLPMCMPYLLKGTHPYETGESRFVRSIIQPGDICMDIGANVGWYSTLLAALVGKTGRVYAFEPNERALRMLRKTASLYPQLQIIPAGLSDHEGTTQLHVPTEEVKASLQRSPGKLVIQECRVITLDGFLAQQNAPRISFVKCDAEGAELDILKGSVRTLGGDQPPIWMMEMSPETTEWFGYTPDTLVDFFKQFTGTGFTPFAIDPYSGKTESSISADNVRSLRRLCTAVVGTSAASFRFELIGLYARVCTTPLSFNPSEQKLSSTLYALHYRSRRKLALLRARDERGRAIAEKTRDQGFLRRKRYSLC